MVLAGLALALADAAAAQNSLGLGRPEQAIRPEGLLAPFLLWVKAQQESFYTAMRLHLQAMRTDATHLWVLIGLSFAYGVFHAAGPGHGKAVISSYMIANEVAARRGIVLSMASALAQALTAIAVVAAFVLVLRGMGLKQSEATGALEVASYGAVAALGAWLLWSKLFGVGHRHAAGNHAHRHGDGHHHQHHQHDHGHACGHAHGADPGTLKGEALSLRQAWSAIAAVGLRPCSGALIVLTFAFLNGLYAAGIASTFAMAFGTGMTVAILAALAVWAKDLAIGIGGLNDRAAVIHRGIEIAGAALVLILGLTLLGASLYV
ncbi:MAG: nickel/cobalt efflux system [Alphaproteobacteria bacterium]|nr:MAG: nickel/cobalt efflux system [Alphaproteobacteria bacterium]